MDKQYRTHWRETEVQIRNTQKSNNAQVQQLAKNLRHSQLEHQEFQYADERRLQLEAHTFRMSQNMVQTTLNAMQQPEHEVHRLKHLQNAEPHQLKEQWKKQVSQPASYKAEIHAL